LYSPSFWLYFTNASLLIVHEIDSAYWKEWQLFKLPGGISFFLIIHIPLIALVLYGLIEVYNFTYTGVVFSLLLSLAGIFAFSIHAFFIKRRHPEFKTVASIGILTAALLLSVGELIVTASYL
jgi:hypothetical protein